MSLDIASIDAISEINMVINTSCFLLSVCGLKKNHEFLLAD